MIFIDAFVYWYPVGMVADELGNGQIIPLGDPNVRYMSLLAKSNFYDNGLELFHKGNGTPF